MCMYMCIYIYIYTYTYIYIYIYMCTYTYMCASLRWPPHTHAIMHGHDAYDSARDARDAPYARARAR